MLRSQYAIAFLITIVFASTFWYQSNKHICPVPVPYRLGEIDKSFTISSSEAREAMTAATALWENMAGQDLFVYDDNAHLTVSFVFDDRQALANAQQSDEARLNQVQADNQEIRDTIAVLQTNYDVLQTAFTERKAAYDTTLAAYNDQVRQANDRGGASPAEFSALAAEQATLQAELAALQREASELNSIATQLNTLSSEENRLVRAYNAEVTQYNDRYSDGEAFTQGDYTGDAINIYKFSNQNELVSVLAHEFGHALSILHVEEPGALMYYLLEEGAERTPALTEADIAAFAATCQFDTRAFKLRQFIRSIIS